MRSLVTPEQVGPEPAHWLVQSLSAVPTPVGRVVPSGFESYALVSVGQLDAGSLSSELAKALISLLAGFTGDDEDCFFAVWNGYAGVVVSDRDATVRLPPERDLYVFRGRLVEGLAAYDGFDRRANRWWPSGRAWCIGSDIYGESVVLGGSRRCVDALVSDARLHATHLDPGKSLSTL